ncbi:MAG: hypothetical protein J2P17_34185 [Mycobacterium sp.]|nr:hypothetical protein [Mycobacterium sp.]
MPSDVYDLVVHKVDQEFELLREDSDRVPVFDGDDLQAPVVQRQDVAGCEIACVDSHDDFQGEWWFGRTGGVM